MPSTKKSKKNSKLKYTNNLQIYTRPEDCVHRIQAFQKQPKLPPPDANASTINILYILGIF